MIAIVLIAAVAGERVPRAWFMQGKRLWSRPSALAKSRESLPFWRSNPRAGAQIRPLHRIRE
jgi:hypothetical protein